MVENNDVLKLFANIGRGDISENSNNLISDNILSSIEYIMLINEIEQKFGPIPPEKLEISNFENIKVIKNLIDVLNNA